MRFKLFPFGCQMNRADAEALAGALAGRGFVPARDGESAEVVVYFTCSVRKHAEDRVWSHLGRWRKARESGEVKALAVLGCMAERLGEGIRRRMPHVDVVAGPSRLAEVPALLETALDDFNHREHGERLGGQAATTPSVSSVPSASSVAAASRPGAGGLDPAKALLPRPFQAYLPVMEGCDSRCAYCVVPALRGPGRSVAPHEVERSARELVGRGAVEITLLGQNVDAYGRDLGRDVTLASLIRRLAPIEGLARLRFVTSHPRHVTDELLGEMAAHPNVMPYLHAPAQSGSDRILAAMARGYTRERYLAMLARARATVPGIEVASDFIVGFPGETDGDFEDTMSLVREARLQGAFVFMYSPRPGTRAAGLADDVPREAKRERHAALSAVQREVSLSLNLALVGREVRVLAEGVSRTDPARFTGRTETFRIAAFTAPRDPTGEILPVLVEDATALVLLGGA